MAQAAEAHRHLESRESTGKLILIPDEHGPDDRDARAHVTSFRYGDLSPSAVRRRPSATSSTAGCAMGGATSEPAVIARVWRGLGRAPSARLLGDGRGPHPKPRPRTRHDRFSTPRHLHHARFRPPERCSGDPWPRRSFEAVGRFFSRPVTARGLRRPGDHVALRDRGLDQGVRGPASRRRRASARTVRDRDGGFDRDRITATWPRDRRGPASWRCGKAVRPGGRQAASSPPSWRRPG